jgi:signal transduction histidine kinase
VKGSYPRNISIVSIIFICLILSLAVVNLYVSIQFRNQFIHSDRDKIVSIASLCAQILDGDYDRDIIITMGKYIATSFGLSHFIITDTIGTRVYDSRLHPREFVTATSRIDFTEEFGRLPAADEIMHQDGRFIYHSEAPPFFLYASVEDSFTAEIDRIFLWYVLYITVSLIFVGFLGIFLIRNLFLPMRYVTNLADEMGVEMKKEDFVSEAFREMYEKLRSREQTLVEVSAYIAHEFRNSIGAIIGMARLVERGKKGAADIIKECQIMEELILRLLEYARPVQMMMARFNIDRLIREAVERAALSSRIDVETSVEPDASEMMGDYDLLLTALMNIMKNSVEAISNKGTITIDIHAEGDYIMMAIRDSGSGIDERSLDKILNPFFTTKAQGMGLGLAYVKKIVEAHGGRIKVESTRGSGTCIMLTFPRERGSEKQDH